MERNFNKDILINWLRSLLKPVMKFCIRRSLKVQEVIDACKYALIEAARDELTKNNENISVSKLSVITGVHRPEITKLLNSPEIKDKSQNIITKIIGHWQADKDFLGSDGKPKVLTADGIDSQFAELVSRVSTALSPYTVLYELERIKAVERTDEGLKLLTYEYVNSRDFKHAAAYLERESDDLINAVEENLTTKRADLNLHLQTEYDAIVISETDKIRKWFLQEGTKFHKKAREFLTRYDKDINNKINKHEPATRVSVCTFSYIPSDSVDRQIKQSKRKGK